MKTIVEFGNEEFLVSWRLDFNNDEVIVIYSIKDKDDLELYDQVSQHPLLYNDYIRLVRDVEEVERLYAQMGDLLGKKQDWNYEGFVWNGERAIKQSSARAARIYIATQQLGGQSDEKQRSVYMRCFNTYLRGRGNSDAGTQH